MTFACEGDEGEGLLIRVPYLFWREIDYLPRALADKGGMMLPGRVRFEVGVSIGRSDDVLQTGTQ